MPARAPLVSVLLPVRDARPWLESSLASLWRQRFPDFEVIAVDDGSSDGSGEALERAAAREPRLRVLHTPPRGLPRALNLALAHARGRLIARHDADDLSHRERFGLQIEFLAHHQEIDAVGSGLRLFPSAATGAGMKRYAAWHNRLLRHEEMARERWVESPLAHATAMVRRHTLERVGGWREHGWAEDVDLWMRLFEHGARFAKLPRTLYAWRQHAGSATRRDPRYQTDRFLALRLHYLLRRFTGRGASFTLVGTGTSGERWRRALSDQGRLRDYRTVRTPAALPAADGPLVLVYGAAPARARWRTALAAQGRVELRDFVFVA